jgi:hypothetical protein
VAYLPKNKKTSAIQELIKQLKDRWEIFICYSRSFYLHLGKIVATYEIDRVGSSILESNTHNDASEKNIFSSIEEIGIIYELLNVNARCLRLMHTRAHRALRIRVSTINI